MTQKKLFNNKGVVMFMVLVIMTVLLILSITIMYAVRNQTSSLKTETMEQQSYVTADNATGWVETMLGSGNATLSNMLMALSTSTSFDNPTNSITSGWLDIERLGRLKYDIVRLDDVAGAPRFDVAITAFDGNTQTVLHKKLTFGSVPSGGPPVNNPFKFSFYTAADATDTTLLPAFNVKHTMYAGNNIEVSKPNESSKFMDSTFITRMDLTISAENPYVGKNEFVEVFVKGKFKEVTTTGEMPFTNGGSLYIGGTLPNGSAVSGNIVEIQGHDIGGSTPLHIYVMSTATSVSMNIKNDWGTAHITVHRRTSGQTVTVTGGASVTTGAVVTQAQIDLYEKKIMLLSFPVDLYDVIADHEGNVSKTGSIVVDTEPSTASVASRANIEFPATASVAPLGVDIANAGGKFLPSGEEYGSLNWSGITQGTGAKKMYIKTNDKPLYILLTGTSGVFNFTHNASGEDYSGGLTVYVSGSGAVYFVIPKTTQLEIGKGNNAVTIMHTAWQYLLSGDWMDSDGKFVAMNDTTKKAQMATYFSKIIHPSLVQGETCPLAGCKYHTGVNSDNNVIDPDTGYVKFDAGGFLRLDNEVDFQSGKGMKYDGNNATTGQVEKLHNNIFFYDLGHRRNSGTPAGWTANENTYIANRNLIFGYIYSPRSYVTLRSTTLDGMGLIGGLGSYNFKISGLTDTQMVYCPIASMEYPKFVAASNTFPVSEYPYGLIPTGTDIGGGGGGGGGADFTDPVLTFD
ncbi:MAG: hypothetical protein LBN40_04180 [Oscillospiraceae bacterium]|jgi:hypothetical protein|nr:hypothetical protein [Oscillospiraceae bacterium]